ncbi:hypothetical protein PV325_010546 [Microctonus aethiopoides]|nr:hypothetical protein PV325_010546 [Microctonus aethiopoides]
MAGFGRETEEDAGRHFWITFKFQGGPRTSSVHWVCVAYQRIGESTRGWRPLFFLYHCTLPQGNDSERLWKSSGLSSISCCEEIV